MIAEALEKLNSIIRKGIEPVPVDVPGPGHIKTFIMPDGEVKEVVGNPQPRLFGCETPESFVDLCRRYKATRAHLTNDSVVAYVDDDREKEQIRLDFKPSSEWRELLSLLSRAVQDGVGPKDVCSTFRVGLRYTLDEEARVKLMEQLGTIKIRTDESAGSTSARGQDTMGASVDIASSPDVELPPELLRLRVRPLENLSVRDVRFEVELYIEPDMNTKRWAIVPMPDELDRAVLAARQHIFEQVVSVANGVGGYPELELFE